MWNEHTGTSNNGVYFNGRTSVQQPATFNYMVDGSQLPAAKNPSSCNYYNSFKGSQQSSFVQNTTPVSQNGQQSMNQCIYYQDSRLINSHPPQSGLQLQYLQQNAAMQLKSQGANQQRQTWYQLGIALTQNRSGLCNSNTGMMAKPAVRSGTTTTASLLHQQRVYTGQCESSLIHNNQVAHNPCNGDMENQWATSYVTKFLSTPQPRRDSYVKIAPAPQETHVSNPNPVSYPIPMGQRTQQHPTQLYPTLQPKGAIQQSVKEDIILRIADDLKRSYPINQDVYSPTDNCSHNRGVQSNLMNQPTPTNSTNTSQPSVFVSGEGLTGLIPVISKTQNKADSPQKRPHIVLNLRMIDQSNSSGKESRNSQSLETPSAEENSVNSPSGRTNSRAIAVVQPLSQQSCGVSDNHEAFDTAAISSCESPPEILEKTETSKMLVDQHDAYMTPPSDVPISQSCESGEDPEASISETSSGKTVTWTVNELQKLIEREDATKQSCSDSLVDCKLKLHRLFVKELSTPAARISVFQFLKECAKNHVTNTCTVLTQTKLDFENQPEHYHVLRDDVYSEPPFRSSWLNTNDQLDDIDKEFGFPTCLRYAGINNSDSRPGRVTAASINRKQTPSEVSKKDLPQTEPKLVEADVEMMQVEKSNVEKLVELKPAESRSVECSPIQDASPEDTQKDPSNPFYSFQIQVLPPEEAKLLYEQTKSPERPSKDVCADSQESGCQPDKDDQRSVAAEVTKLDFLQLDETDATTKLFCCLSRLVESLCESRKPMGNCQCGTKEPVKAVIDLTEVDTSNESDTETMDVPGKSSGDAIIIIDEDASVDPEVDACPDAVSVQSISSDGDESEVENLNNSDISISSPESEGEEKEFENPNSSDLNISSPVSEAEEGRLSDVSSDLSMENEEQPPVGKTMAPLPDVELTGKKLHGSKAQRRAVSPLFKRPSSCELTDEEESQLSNGPEVSVDPPVRKHLDSNIIAAKLVLYGSAQDPMNKGQGHFSSHGAVGAMPMPPEVLSVPLAFLKRRSSEPLLEREESVKSRIFEMWKKSFPVTPLRRRDKKSSFPPGAKEKPLGSPKREKKLKLHKSGIRPKDGSKYRVESSGICPGKPSEKMWKSTASTFAEFKEKYMRRKRHSSS